MGMVLLTTAQLAKRLGIAPITLQIWRSQGIGIPFVKQGTRVFYRLADVKDYERRNVDSLSAWLLGSDRPLPEMEALVRAANLPLQKIRQRIANPPEIDGEAVSPLQQQHPQPADSAESPEPEPTEPTADSDWQPQVPPDHSSHQSPINAGSPWTNHPKSTFAASLPTPRPFALKAPELITTQQAAARLGLTTNALHELRCRDDGLQIFQKGFTVGYRLEDIHAFEQREASAIIRHENVGRVSEDGSADTLAQLALELMDSLEVDDGYRVRCRALYSRLFAPETAVRQIVTAFGKDNESEH